jgi:hypothetical protein
VIRASRGENASAKTNAAQASHLSRIVRRISKAAFPPVSRSGRTVPVRQHSHYLRAPHLPVLLQNPASKKRCSATLRRPVAQPTQRAGNGGGRNARATGTHSRAFPIFPRRFTLENHRSAPSFAAIIVGQAFENPTFSLNSLCRRSIRAATRIRFSAVQKLWTMTLPCGKLRKTKEGTPAHGIPGVRLQ